MTLTLQITLHPQEQARLTARAKQQGLTLEAYVQTVLSSLASFDARVLKRLPRQERNQLLAAQTQAAAALYEADLARPPAERELTAFTLLDADPLYDRTG